MEFGQITINSVLAVVRDAGSLGLLVMILVGGYKRWWVWGYLYDSTVRERDEWKRLALSGTDLADKAVDAVRHNRGKHDDSKQVD